jgi:hypothetical protein
MDGLDNALRSNRETISEGPLLAIAQDVLKGVFNAVRPTLEERDAEERPGAKLARKIAASPSSLSRRPIVDLARAVVERKATSRYLNIPQLRTSDEREVFLADLEGRAARPETFVTGLTIDYDGLHDAGIAQFDTISGCLRINAWHPFVATFHEEFASKGVGQPLELLAMAEVIAEAHMHVIGIKHEQIEAFLSLRDQLLRNLANESGRQSAFAVAAALQNARNNPDALEEKLCDSFRSLGFEVTRIGGKKKPDGVATAILPADAQGNARQYGVSLEAKSKQKDAGTIAAGTVKVSAIVRQRDDYRCQHALVVGRAFPTLQGDKAVLAQEIEDDRKKTAALGDLKTITLITIDDLAKLVRLRPLKQLGLRKLQDLFISCRTPEQSAQWIESIKNAKVKKPPYKQIVTTIEGLHKKFKKSTVNYGALRVELSHLNPPIEYETDEALIELCKAMAQMAPGALFAGNETVELDQSATNVIAAIDAATKDYPIEEQ